MEEREGRWKGGREGGREGGKVHGREGAWEGGKVEERDGIYTIWIVAKEVKGKHRNCCP